MRARVRASRSLRSRADFISAARSSGVNADNGNAISETRLSARHCGALENRYVFILADCAEQGCAILRSASLAAALARRGGGKMGTAFVRDPVIFLMP